MDYQALPVLEQKRAFLKGIVRTWSR